MNKTTCPKCAAPAAWEIKYDLSGLPMQELKVISQCRCGILEKLLSALLDTNDLEDFLETCRSLLKPKFPVLMDQKDAARLLGVGVRKLEVWRNKGREGGPPYYKIGGAVRYSEADLTEWVETQKIAR